MGQNLCDFLFSDGMLMDVRHTGLRIDVEPDVHPGKIARAPPRMPRIGCDEKALVAPACPGRRDMPSVRVLCV
jgi:hypothetical protein